jgi:hypothetical protein
MKVVKKLMAGEYPAGETREERICDAINYLRLIYGILKEEEEGRRSTTSVRVTATASPSMLRCVVCQHTHSRYGVCGVETLLGACDCAG